MIIGRNTSKNSLRISFWCWQIFWFRHVTTLEWLELFERKLHKGLSTDVYSSAKHVALVIRSRSDKFHKTICSSDDICVHDPFFPTIIALYWKNFFFCRFVVVWSTAESCDVSMRLFYTWFGSRKQVLWKVTLYILVPVLKTQYLLSAWHRHSRVTVTQIRCHALVSTLSNLVKGTHRFSTIWSSF